MGWGVHFAFPSYIRSHVLILFEKLWRNKRRKVGAVHQRHLGQESMLGHRTFHVIAGGTARNDIANFITTGACEAIDSNSSIRCRFSAAIVTWLRDEVLIRCKVQGDCDFSLLRLFEKLPPTIPLTMASMLMLGRRPRRFFSPLSGRPVITLSESMNPSALTAGYGISHFFRLHW